MDELEEAIRCIDVKSTCACIPYAATKAAKGLVKEYLLAHQNFMLFLRSVPKSAKRQPTYHKHKASRPRNRFGSYRTLSLSVDELRLAEELWAFRSESAVWEAAGTEQMGRSSCLLVTYVDIETGLIRSSRGLPSGVLSSDFAEAFDTAWPAATLIQLQEAARIGGERLHMAYEFIGSTSIVVVSGACKTIPVELQIGMPEGRRLSPAFYIALASLARQCMGEMPGVGLDPPEEAIVAYHMMKDGTDAEQPDAAKCKDLV